jgi:hypothetical protein
MIISVISVADIYKKKSSRNYTTTVCTFAVFVDKISWFTAFTPSLELPVYPADRWCGDRRYAMGTNVVFNLSLFKLASKLFKGWEKLRNIRVHLPKWGHPDISTALYFYRATKNSVRNTRLQTDYQITYFKSNIVIKYCKQLLGLPSLFIPNLLF